MPSNQKAIRPTLISLSLWQGEFKKQMQKLSKQSAEKKYKTRTPWSREKTYLISAI